MQRNLDDWITGYMAYTENSEPPNLYREWIAVSVVAAALQRKCRLRWGELTFYPNMYIVLVGPSGKCRKGTAMGTGAAFLRDLGVKQAAEAITREALIRELAGTSKIIEWEDGTMEMHASLTIYSQELTVFLGYDNKQLISDITDWYDCRDNWTYRTKNMGTDEIVGVWVNMIGATTPELVQSALPQDAIGGGLASRMIFVFEERKGKIVPAPFITQEARELRVKLKEDLDNIYTIQGEFVVNEEFVEAWTDWYVEQEANPPFTDPHFAGYIERRPNHILKLCMILAASENSRTLTGGDMLITEKILSRAIDLLTRTEIKMPRTFMGHGSAQNASITTQLMAIIAAKQTIQRAELLQMFFADLDSPRELDDLLALLAQMGFCTIAIQNNRTVITYNPNNRYGSAFRGGGTP